jgi:hypothetical protein
MRNGVDKAQHRLILVLACKDHIAKLETLNVQEAAAWCLDLRRAWEALSCGGARIVSALKVSGAAVGTAMIVLATILIFRTRDDAGCAVAALVV